MEGDWKRALRGYDSVAILARDAGLNTDVANAMKGYAECCIELGDYQVAEDRLMECLLIFRDMGDSYGTGLSLTHLGTIAFLRGNLAEALEYANQSLNLLGKLEGDADSAYTLALLALIAHSHNQPRAAAEYAHAAIERSTAGQDQLAEAYSVEVLCHLLAGTGAMASIGRLLGAVDTWRARAGCPRTRVLAVLYNSTAAAQHSAAAWQTEYAAGRDVPIATAAEIAMTL